MKTITLADYDARAQAFALPQESPNPAMSVFKTHDARVMNHSRRLVRMVNGQIESDELRS